MDEDKAKPSENAQLQNSRIESLLEQLGNVIADGVVRGLEGSGVLQKLSELFDNVSQKIEQLEQKFNTQPTSPKPPEPVSPPRAIPTPHPSGSLQIGLPPMPMGMPPARPSSRLSSRLRSTPRPTITYRIDPRKELEPLSADTDKTCSEPGCDRPARARGLCSLHYQRIRYKERKVEQKQTSIRVLPPPPPPPVNRRPSITSVHGNGGTRGIFALLYDEKGRKLLAGLINQMKTDRSDLVKKLNAQYDGMPGVPVDEEDVIRSVHYHDLTEALRKREREVICRCLNKLRGSLVKTAQKMKMDPDRLRSRINELELFDEVSRIRNEFKEEVLEQLDFNDRLDLALTKEKYLEDLGIVREVDTSLRKELAAQIALVKSDANQDDANQTIREALKLDEERFRRLLRRFDLDTDSGLVLQPDITPGDPA